MCGCKVEVDVKKRDSFFKPESSSHQRKGVRRAGDIS